MALWVALALAMTAQAQTGSWRELSAKLEAQAAAWGARPAALAVPQVPRAVESPSQAPAVPGGPVIVDVEPLLNRTWSTPIAFQAGPLTVRISGMKSSNGQKNWFLSLCADPCVSPQFYKGRDLLRYKPFLSPVAVLNGSQLVEFGGRRYKVYLDGQLRNREESRLRVEPLDAGGPKFEWEVREIAAAVHQGGHPLVINERPFRLLYVQEILENAAGGFAGLSTERSFAFLTQDKGRYIAYGVNAKDVPRDHVEAFIKAPSTSEDKPPEKVPPQLVLRVGLRLDESGRLEVHDLGRLTARPR